MAFSCHFIVNLEHISWPRCRCSSHEAVVGAGIGGTAAAFYLREEFGAGVKIDVFESGDVGGPLATVRIGDHEYETGGLMIHPLNLHMKHFVEKLGNVIIYQVEKEKFH